MSASPLPNPPFPERCGLNAAIVDCSGSINLGELKQMRIAITQFVDALAGTPSNLSIATFTETAKTLLPLTSVLEPNGLQTVQSTLNSIPHSAGAIARSSIFKR